MFTPLNIALRRQRRRLVVLAAMLTLAGAVVAAHSVTGGDHMGDGTVMCLAVAGTAAVAIGAAVVLSALAWRPRWPVPASLYRQLRFVAAPVSIRARAGPPALQVFRL